MSKSNVANGGHFRAGPDHGRQRRGRAHVASAERGEKSNKCLGWWRRPTSGFGGDHLLVRRRPPIGPLFAKADWPGQGLQLRLGWGSGWSGGLGTNSAEKQQGLLLLLPSLFWFPSGSSFRAALGGQAARELEPGPERGTDDH